MKREWSIDKGHINPDDVGTYSDNF